MNIFHKTDALPPSPSNLRAQPTQIAKGGVAVAGPGQFAYSMGEKSESLSLENPQE